MAARRISDITHIGTVAREHDDDCSTSTDLGIASGSTRRGRSVRYELVDEDGDDSSWRTTSDRTDTGT